MQTIQTYSSLDKHSTKNVLNRFPSCFVTAAVLPNVFSAAKLGITFRRSFRVAFARCALHGALSCMNTKSLDLYHWESNKTTMGRDRSPNNVQCESEMTNDIFLLITLPNVGRFVQFLHHWIHQGIFNRILVIFPPHLNYVATLPCEM